MKQCAPVVDATKLRSVIVGMYKVVSSSFLVLSELPNPFSGCVCFFLKEARLCFVYVRLDAFCVSNGGHDTMPGVLHDIDIGAVKQINTNKFLRVFFMEGELLIINLFLTTKVLSLRGSNH